MNAFVVSGLVLAEAACPLLARIRSANARRGFPLPKVRISDAEGYSGIKADDV